MHYDRLPALHFICECSHFLYLRQFLALEFRSYLPLVYKTDFPLSFDTGVRGGRNIGKNVKHEQGAVVVGVCGYRSGKADMIVKPALNINIVPLLECLPPQEKMSVPRFRGAALDYTNVQNHGGRKRELRTWLKAK